MRPHGKTKLGFFPLPLPEAQHLKNLLAFASVFSALDPCVGDGAAFTWLLGGAESRAYGIEIDANRAEQARALGIETLHANTMDVRCPTESVSLLYLNPPYDLEVGQTNNQRLELVFLEHTYRWLKPGGVLIFVIPQPQLKPCARILSEYFGDLTVYRLTEPASVQYKQVVVLGSRRKRQQQLRDSELLNCVRWLEMLAWKPDLAALTENPAVRYEVPPSGPVVLTNAGIPKPRLIRLGVQRVDDPHHPRGYRELRSPAEMRKLLNRKIRQQAGICAICHEEFTDYNDIVPDHKEPKGMGGAWRDDHPDNIQAIHW